MDLSLLHKSATLIWNDEDNRLSFLLCQEAYNIKVILARKINDTLTEITVYGNTDDVNHFLDDVKEDNIEPMDNMSIGIDDDDYEAWLNNEVNRLLHLSEISSDYTSLNTLFARFGE